MKALLVIGIAVGYGLIYYSSVVSNTKYNSEWEIYKANCVAEHNQYYCDRTIGVTKAGPSIIVVPRR